VTIFNYSAIANFYTLQIIIAYAKYSQSAAVSTSHSMVSASNGGDYSIASITSSLHRFPYNWQQNDLYVWVWVLWYDRRSVGQSYLGTKHRYWADDQIFITVRQSRVSWFDALSLTRGRICRLQLLLAFAAQSFSGLSTVGLVIMYYCLRFETSHFVASYDSQSYG
jgi:hypothetical protein